jgi:hypothetical protein
MFTGVFYCNGQLGQLPLRPNAQGEGFKFLSGE